MYFNLWFIHLLSAVWLLLINSSLNNLLEHTGGIKAFLPFQNDVFIKSGYTTASSMAKSFTPASTTKMW